MKLTEQQLAQIFQDSTRCSQQVVNVADCLHAPNETDAEAIVSNFNTAHAAQLATHMQAWSQQVANDLLTCNRTSWTQRFKRLLSQWLPNSAITVPALAVVFTLSAVVFLNAHQMQTAAVDTDVVTNDVINSLPFEGDNDRLSKGGFDGSDNEDRLFKANFS